MASWRDSIPSKWLKAADLDGKPHLYTVVRFSVEKSQEGEKFPAVWFKEEPKGLRLNVTNGKAIERIAGSADPERWAGLKIVVFPTETELRGETVDCIRVRAPKPGARPPQTIPMQPEEEQFVPEDDDVPF